MKLRCAIIDDEPLAVTLLESYVKKTPYLELVGAYSSGVEAMQSDELAEVELIFLDIQMPTLNGLEFSKMVNPQTRIIFTTAFSQYALEGYRVNALDYLVKPISYGDFVEATQKAVAWFERRGETTPPVTTEEESRSPEMQHIPEEMGYIYVKSEYKLIRIELKDLLYVEGLKDYVKFYLEGVDAPVISLMNMKRADELLPSDQFMRVHRSYIVRKDKIKVIERSRIIFGKVVIPIGDAYKEAFLGYINC